jgi:AhpC/TSA family
MAETPPLTLDIPAPDFRLPGTDGRTYAFDDIAGENGTVIVFICNHCPYVKAVIDRLVADARVLMAEVSASPRSAPTTPGPTPRTHSRRCSTSRRRTRFRSPISTTRTSQSREPMGPSARPTSSATTPTAGSNTVVASTRAALARPQPAHAGSSSRPCVPLRRPAWRRPARCRRSAVRSSGRLPRKAGRHATRAPPCPHSRSNLLSRVKTGWGTALDRPRQRDLKTPVNPASAAPRS